jgi:outer membrane protein assembly factor BamB
MKFAGRALLWAGTLALAGCSYIPWYQDEAKKPAPLPEFSAQVTPKVAWSASVGKARDFRFVPKVDGTRIIAAAADGTVTILDAENGSVVARVDAKRALSGGAWGEGDTLIVGTIKGQVVALDTAGKEKWVAQVGGEVLAPAVLAGKNVIVRTADGRIFSLALADGKRQWVYQRATPSLLLRAEAGLHVTPTNVVVGYPGGKLIALDLDDGKLTWEVTVSLPRGSTELERVADVAGVPVVEGGRICAAAFQGKVACFDIQSGNSVWSRDISSATGLAMDERNLYLSDDKDSVHALDRESGASRWKQDKLPRRKLSAPVVFDARVVVGDSLGYLHVLSRDNGAFVGRLALDGSAVNAMVVTKSGLLVQTAAGMLALVRF